MRGSSVLEGPAQWYQEVYGASSRPWYATDDGQAEIRVDGPIGFIDPDTGEGITAAEFDRALKAAAPRPVLLVINSPGGLVFDGLSIVDSIRGYRPGVVARVVGIAASAASFIAASASTTEIAESAMLMIHRAWGFTMGNAADHSSTADILNKIDGVIAGIYAGASNRTASFWREKMQATTWFDANEAVSLGLASKIVKAAAPRRRYTAMNEAAIPQGRAPTYGEMESLLARLGGGRDDSADRRHAGHRARRDARAETQWRLQGEAAERTVAAVRAKVAENDRRQWEDFESMRRSVNRRHGVGSNGVPF